MSVILVDLLGLILIATGVALVLKRPGPSGEAGIYARRIAGTMMAAFGLALGMMVTLYHFVSAG
jgi:hypothetical protein